MEKGHVELGEILFVALLVVGLAAAVILLVGGNGAPASQTTEPGNTTQNATPEAPPAQAESAANATSNQTQPPVEAQQPNVTNKSMDQLFQDGLERADTWFYSSAGSGNYDTKTYGWAMGLANGTPDSIPIKENDLRAADVRFDSRYVDSLRGFTFRMYSSPGFAAPTKLYGIAIFTSNSTPLDAANKTFDVQYDPYPGGPQILEGCQVINSSAWATPGGSPLTIYDITCKIMYGVYP
jgi:hypothetical protein